jgi:four helix bundle protein
MQRFTELKVWQRGHALVLKVYRLTTGFPLAERYGLTSQLRRAILSVPTNIAEGSKRVSSQEYARFLNMAEASLAEAEYLLLVSRGQRLLHGGCRSSQHASRPPQESRRQMIPANALSTFNSPPKRKPTRFREDQQKVFLSSYFDFQLSTFSSDTKRGRIRTSQTHSTNILSFLLLQLSTFDFQPCVQAHTDPHSQHTQQPFFLSSYFNFQLSTFNPAPKRILIRTPNTLNNHSFFALTSTFNFRLSTLNSLPNPHAH